MSRSVPEWIGKTDDSAPPLKVRLRVFEKYGKRCHWSGRPILGGDPWDLDHIKPLKDGGENREGNLAPILRDRHREKTAAENRQRAKEERIAAKHLGIKKTSSRGLSVPPGMKYDWSRGRYVREGSDA
jgi:5-methylcytosine-specific restriction endonuclease McrA